MEAGEGRSSSNELSSAPNSDLDAPSARPTAPPRIGAPSFLGRPEDSTIVVQGSHLLGVANAGGRAATAATPATTSHPRQDTTPKVRKPRETRKKKDPQSADADKKDKPAKKPRAAPGTAAASRKKPKIETGLPDPPTPASTPSLEPTASAKPSPLGSSLLNSAGPPAGVARDAAKLTELGFTRNLNGYSHSPHLPAPEPPMPPQIPPQAATTRANGIYDPVRSSILRPTDFPSPAVAPPIPPTPPRPTYNPSSSPAISSIIHPPEPSAVISPSGRAPYQMEPVPSLAEPKPDKSLASAMEVDAPSASLSVAKKPAQVKKASSDAGSTAPSPKPARAKEAPPPLPQGSGLLSASLFGAESKAEPGDKGPTIVLHVDLKGQSNQVINFARMAEEKYGFAALYPRQAAQKERLARVAAAGAALERSANSSKIGGSPGESGDEDVSVDIDRDSDNDGDVMMGGVNGGNETGGNSGTDAAAPKRRRRRKIEEYDQDDPFVDDSELLWEQQAAASKDGFFVYCGALVPEGEKPAVERADGTIKRGRGRGRGGLAARGGRGAASAGTNSEAGTGTGAASTRGGGPGSRGGTTTRKPRITKAERALREQEKANREKMAVLAAKPLTYPS